MRVRVFQSVQEVLSHVSLHVSPLFYSLPSFLLGSLEVTYWTSFFRPSCFLNSSTFSSSLFLCAALLLIFCGFPGCSGSKRPACSEGDPGSVPGSGSSPGEGNGAPLQCSCLETPMDGGAWLAAVDGVAVRHS